MLIESFHSGPRGRRRYCSLHRPTTRLVKPVGVVLCNPLGHEYYRAYRAYVKFAQALAEAGFPALRFDYVGTGDSDGDAGHARLDDWVADALAAADDLQRSEDVTHVAFAGMRFGGMLARLAAARAGNARAVVLWDDVEDGRAYLSELDSLHGQMLKDQERFPRPRASREAAATEFIGVTYARRFLDDVATISNDTADAALRHFRVRSAGANASHGEDDIVGNIDYGWNDRQRLEETIVDPAVVTALVSRLNTALT